MTATANFAFVQEEDAFLALFPHRYDFIYAKHPEPGARPNWQTESRYPLPDRLIQEGESLYGVRFGPQTRYCLLDIDAGSAYHPQCDRFAITRICAAFESIGLVSYFACTSSYSGGIHLYFPFEQAQRSWELASVVASLLERAGFVIKPGQLEIFPNSKPFAAEGKQSLFNAHRLPLQIGSYLLNEDWEPVWSDRLYFARLWHQVQSRNEINSQVFQRLLKQAKQKARLVSGKADKFLNDLNTEIEIGWTGSGQTNRLLGRIALRTYVFHHVLTGSTPLTGQMLIDEIVRVARSLPGYLDWCNHQHEIEKRAEEWARCVENSRYYPYNVGKSLPVVVESLQPEVNEPSWNQQQQQTARARIQQAIAILNTENLPATATARFKLLTQLGIGGSTLYRHRDLWHPEHLVNQSMDQSVETSTQISVENSVEINESVENPPYPPDLSHNEWVNCAVGAFTHSSCTSLFPQTGRNVPLDEEESDRNPDSFQDAGRNLSLDRLLNVTQDDFKNDEYEVQTALSQKTTLQLNQVCSGAENSGCFIHALPQNSRFQKEENRKRFELAQAEQRRQRYETHFQKQKQRLQNYLDSGDPILIAEAQRSQATEVMRL